MAKVDTYEARTGYFTFNNPITRQQSTEENRSDQMTDNLNNTVLAMQLLSGVRLYSVKYSKDSAKQYTYKATEAYEPGTPVIAQDSGGLKIVTIVEEILDFDFSYSADWNWIITAAPSLAFRIEELESMDKKARAKIGRARALKAAQDILDMEDATAALVAPEVTSNE